MRDELLWMDPYKISEWAYYQCRDIKDEMKGDLEEKEEKAAKKKFVEMKEFITNSFWAACFIVNIEEDVEMFKFVVDEQDNQMLHMCKNIDEYIVKRTDKERYEEQRRSAEYGNELVEQGQLPVEKQAGWFKARVEKLKSFF